MTIGDIDSKFAKLQNNHFIISKMHRLSYTDTDEEEKDSKQKTQRELFEKAYVISEEGIYENYLNTLQGFYYQLSRKTLTSFFEYSPIEDILEVVLKDETNLNKFIKYIQIRGNETIRIKQASKDDTHFLEFMNVIQKIIETCAKNKKYFPIIDMLLNNSLIEGTLKTIKRAEKIKKKVTIINVFNEEGIDLEALSSLILPNLVTVIAEEIPELIFDKDILKRVLSVLLIIPLAFENDKDLHSE